MAKTRKFTLNTWLATVAMAALLHAGMVDAAGLGRLNVLSQMGQPFVGEIELVNVSRDELSTLQARPAPVAAYQAANLRFDPALNSLRLSVAQRPNGTAYLRVATTRPVAEPYLDLVVELTSQSGRFQRQYAALLDPPGLTEPPAAPPIAAAPAPAAPAAAPAAARPAQRPAAQVAAAPSAPAVAPSAPAAVPRAPAAIIPAKPAAVAPPVPAVVPPATAVVPPAPATTPPAPAPAPKAAAVQPETKPATEPPKPLAVPPAAQSPGATAPAATTQAAQPEPREAAAPPAESAATPQPKIAPPPAPPASKAATPQRGLIDSLMDNLLPIAIGLLALLAGWFGWSALRTRQADQAQAIATASEKTEPITRPAPARAPVAAAAEATAAAAPALAITAAASAATATTSTEPSVANVTDMVDPLEEAQVYLDHGAEEQALDVLRKALVKEPQRQDLQLKLLEIFAARSDKTAFNQLAGQLHQQTGGAGASWERAALLGAALDPGNKLFAAAGNVAAPATPTAREPDRAGIDFNLDAPPAATDPLANTTAMLLKDDAQSLDMEKTMVLPRAEAKVTAAPAAPAAPAVAPLDFNLELPPASTPAPAKPAPSPKAKDDSADRGLDFKIDIPEVNLNLDDKLATSTNAMFEVKSPQWEEVQQKFDLVLAYKEMGDKDGMAEVLREIEREGDASQKAQAQKMIEELKPS